MHEAAAKWNEDIERTELAELRKQVQYHVAANAETAAALSGALERVADLERELAEATAKAQVLRVVVDNMTAKQQDYEAELDRLRADPAD